MQPILKTIDIFRRVGMRVVLLGDSQGYVPSGFSHGAEVTIVGFTVPVEHGESDHIVAVCDASRGYGSRPQIFSAVCLALPEQARVSG